jgi:hypothetical protein
MQNKTIYMTNKSMNVPEHVFKRWKLLNPQYKIEFSIDSDCIAFLKLYFNNYVADMFEQIKDGRYKADLWRLCKLYIHGGIYADIDLVPHGSINFHTKKNSDVSFFSCLSCDKKSIFQAYIICKHAKCPLILAFILSMVQTKPFYSRNGPTFDMYKCLKYNIPNISDIKSDKKYTISQVRIPIFIGKNTNQSNIKCIFLYFIPKDLQFIIKLVPTKYPDKFKFVVKDNILIVNRIDTDNLTIGWECDHTCEMIIETVESIYLFKEQYKHSKKLETAYVSFLNHHILDSRDSTYFKNNKTW